MGNAGAKNEDQKKGGKTHKIVEEFDKVEKKTCGSCGLGCCKAIGVLLALVVILVSIAEIAVSVSTAIATKLFSSDLSGRLVAYVVLAVAAAVALSVTIYATVGLFKKKKKTLHTAGIVLFIIAIIQAIICGVSVNVTTKDESTLAESLKESFEMSISGNVRHMKIWAITSSELSCCGLYGPEDYRDPKFTSIFPPNVPVFCCPNYNSSQSEMVQQVAREICKSSRSYYQTGCGEAVKIVVEKTASMVMAVTIVLIVLEVVLSFYVYITYKVYKKRERQKDEEAVEGKAAETEGSNTEQS